MIIRNCTRLLEELTKIENKIQRYQEILKELHIEIDESEIVERLLQKSE